MGKRIHKTEVPAHPSHEPTDRPTAKELLMLLGMTHSAKV